MEKSNLFFLIAFVVGVGLAYVAVDQAYSTGEAVSSRPSCFDSDKGKVYDVPGYVQYSVRQYFRNRVMVKKDFCANNFLFESYCDSKGLGSAERYSCPNGCKDGACVTSNAEKLPDLVVTGIRYEVVDPRTMKGGESWNDGPFANDSIVNFYAKVRNIGNEKTDKLFYMYLNTGKSFKYSEYKGWGSGSSPAVESDGSNVSTIFLSTSQEKEVFISVATLYDRALTELKVDAEVCVDKSYDDENNNLIKESDESNNCLVKGFVIPLASNGNKTVKTCGDGKCVSPENKLNCPSDCPCSDSDKGLDYFAYGSVTTINDRGDLVVLKDYCSTGYKVNGLYQLTEMYCREDSGVADAKTFGCPYGCKDGACVTQTNQSGCADSDGGIEIAVKGSVKDSNGRYWPDVCQDSSVVIENYCKEGVAYAKPVACPSFNGCENGACVKA